MNTFVIALTGLASMADKTPSEDEIGAGWMYLVLFLLLAGAVAFLGFSLTKHLRKARTNAEHGAFGDPGPSGTGDATH
jgi:hypothetical protein